MKYLKEFAIILAVTCVGEVLKFLLPLPVPASIYGLVLMLVLLISGVVRLDAVQSTASFLIEIMPLMFKRINIRSGELDTPISSGTAK